MATVAEQAKRRITNAIKKRNPYYKGTTKSSSSSSSGTSLYDKVSNYKTRLSNAGIEDNVEDDRNKIEKKLNLEKNQGLLGDIFEIINRPQNALFTGLDNALNGESFGEGLKEGFTGETKTTGKDLLLNNTKLEDEAGKIDAVDVLGLGLDIFADPMDLALIPITGGTNIAAQAGLDAAKAIDTTSAVVGNYSKLDKALGLANKGIHLASGNELVGKGVGKLIKGGAKVADKTIEGGLKLADKVSDAKLPKVASKLGTSVEDLEKSNLLNSYKGLKKAVSDTLDSSKLFKGVMGKSRQASNNAEFANSLQRQAANNFANKATNIATEKGLDINELSRNLTYAIEGSRDRTMDINKVLRDLSIKAPNDLGNAENAKKFVDVLNNYGIKASVVDGVKGAGRYVKIDNARGISEILKNENASKVLKNLKLTDYGISEGEEKAIEAAKKYFKDNGIEDLLDDAKSIYSDINKLGEDVTGVKMTNIRPKTGTSHTLTEEEKAFKNTTGNYTTTNKAFNTQKGSVFEQNALRQENIAKAQQNAERSILNSEKKIYEYEDVVDANGDLIKTNINRNAYSDEFYKQTLEQKQQTIDALTNRKKQYQDALEKINKKEFDTIEGLPKAKQAIINRLKKSEEKINTQIDIVKAQMEGAKSTKKIDAIKEANKNISKGEKFALEQSKTRQTEELLNALRQDMGDITSGIDAQINKATAELENLQNLGAEGFRTKQLEKIKKQEELKAILDSKAGKDYLETSFLTNLDNYVNKSKKQMAMASTYNEALAAGLFNGNEYIKTIENTSPEELKGLVEIKGSTFAKRLKSMTGILPENSDVLREIAETYAGKNVYMDKRLALMLNLTTNNETPNALVKFINTINNTFKKYSVLTPGFQVRNIVGNATNMAMSGMPVTSMGKYYPKAIQTLNSSEDILYKLSTQGLEALSETERASYDIIKQLYQGGFYKAGTSIQDLEDVRKTVQGSKSIINKAANVSADLNENMDTLNRLTLLMYANDHPNYVSKLGATDALDAVRKVLFDPNNMSDIEQNVMKKVIPFYTFTKQNLMFQADNILRNTPKYKKLYKSLDAMYNDLDENSYYQYQKDSMQIPVPFTNANGEQLFLKTNLPISDLGEWIENPVQRLAASASPIIKYPYEVASDIDAYTGQKANYTTFTNFMNSLGIETSEPVQNATAAAEQILNNLGFSNVSTNIIKKVSKTIDAVKDDATPQQAWAEIFRSIVQNTNQEKVENSKLYNDYQAYQEYFKQLKDQGIDVPTIREINAANKNKLNKLKTKRTRSN